MLELFLSPLGRIGRAQWWIAQTLSWTILLGGGTVFSISIFDYGWLTDPFSQFQILFSDPNFTPFILLAFWINLSSTVKRFHDRGMSGWWSMIMFIPLFGAAWLTRACGFGLGDNFNNDYGPAPGAHNASSQVDHNFGEIDDKYERAIAAALQSSASPKPFESEPISSTPVQIQISANIRPAFGKRI